MGEVTIRKRVPKELEDAIDGTPSAPQPQAAQNEPEEAPAPKKAPAARSSADIPSKPKKTGLWEAIGYATGLRK